MKAFDIDVGFGVIQPQMPSILAVVAADGRKRGNEFQNLSLITSMYGICTFIYTYFCHKNKSTYIYSTWMLWISQPQFLIDRFEFVSSSDPCSWSGFLSYSWAMAAYFHSATVPPKKQSQPHEKWTHHFQQRSPPGVEWPQIGCVFFCIFFVKLLNQKVPGAATDLQK